MICKGYLLRKHPKITLRPSRMLVEYFFNREIGQSVYTDQPMRQNQVVPAVLISLRPEER